VAQQVIDRPVFDYMQAYVTCTIISALEKLGALDQLAEHGVVPAELGYEEFLGNATFHYLAERGIVRQDGNRYVLTESGRDLYNERGYLLWLAGGYGEALNSLDTLLTRKQTFGTEVDRDVRWVAVGSALVGAADLRDEVMEILGGIEFSTIGDIGCGNGHFLIDLCRATKAKGVGFDISPAACEEATQEVEKAGFGDRISIVQVDATDVDSVPHLEDIDLVMAFFFMHEVLELGHDVLVNYLTRTCERLPAGAYVLTCEVAPPTQSEDTAEAFGPEYVYTQALMSQGLMNGDQWSAAFTEAGFQVDRIVEGRLPGSRLILVRKPLAESSAG
jgi:SAM-dependent methyltransferase